MFLLLAVLSLTIPTVSRLWGHTNPTGILAQSRGSAVIIMVSYALWLVFQLKTNRALFDADQDSTAKAERRVPELSAVKGLALIGAATGAAPTGGYINQANHVQDEEDEEDVPQLSRLFALITIVASTAVLALNTEFATDSIQAMSSNGPSSAFLGLVILPLLSNDPATVKVAWGDNLNLGLVLTLERAMQTALMVVPLIVLIAWGLDVDDMTMDFDGFSVAALYGSVLIVSYVVQEGHANW
jgi:Ca2+:H+ antiporter